MKFRRTADNGGWCQESIEADTYSDAKVIFGAGEYDIELVREIRVTDTNVAILGLVGFTKVNDQMILVQGANLAWSIYTRAEFVDFVNHLSNLVKE